MRGPFVGTGSVSGDTEPSVEMKRTRTVQPNVSIGNMLKALIPAAVTILAVFWVNASHIFGLFYNQGTHVKGARVALADFDGGDFGRALNIAAARNNQTYEFPTYISVDTSGSSLDQIRQEVFDGRYWAAIIVQPGASVRYDEALNGTASSYDASNVYTYYLLTARYYTLYAGGILSSTLITANEAAAIFSGQFAARRILEGNFANSTTAASALAAPAQATEANAASQSFTDMDDKASINTIGAVFPILMQFFFIMAWNGICNGMHLYAAYNLKNHILARLFWSTIWPLFSSLCSAGWTFAFRGSYRIDSKMFFAYWAVTWVFTMINFDVLDLITGFIPIAFVPFFMVTWVVFNVAAAIGSPMVINHWYRINYFFPALHWFQTLVTIFTQGGVNNLHYTLPTLAGWLVLMKALSPLATKARVRKAKEAFQYYHERDALEGPH